MDVIRQLETEQLKKTRPAFAVGDQVDVHVKIKEGDKERVQVFNGIVIGRRGRGMGESFTVRRLVSGEGVERTFPIQSPCVVDVKVIRSGKVRRAKLHYLRTRTGKATRLKEKVVKREETGA